MYIARRAYVKPMTPAKPRSDLLSSRIGYWLFLIKIKCETRRERYRERVSPYRPAEGGGESSFAKRSGEFLLLKTPRRWSGQFLMPSSSYYSTSDLRPLRGKFKGRTFPHAALNTVVRPRLLFNTVHEPGMIYLRGRVRGLRKCDT